ncbi:hypothetical protein U1Q18_008695 [Sarracenia purpurea var. burkii]
MEAASCPQIIGARSQNTSTSIPLSGLSSVVLSFHVLSGDCLGPALKLSDIFSKYLRSPSPLFVWAPFFISICYSSLLSVVCGVAKAFAHCLCLWKSGHTALQLLGCVCKSCKGEFGVFLIEAKKYKEKKTSETKKSGERHHHKKLKRQKRSSSQCHIGSENIAGVGKERSTPKSLKYNEPSDKLPRSSVRELKESNIQRKMNIDNVLMYSEQPSRALLDSTMDNDETQVGSKRNLDKAKHEKYYLEGQMDSKSDRKGRESRRAGIHISCDISARQESHQKRRNIPYKLSKEERADKLQKMQMDAELHEEQRWKRVKKADEIDAQEALSVHTSRGRNFLDAAQKSVYGSERGGRATIEESVRRRTHYLQSRSEVGEGNAFRR